MRSSAHSSSFQASTHAARWAREVEDLVASGAYLEAGFDHKVLTIPQLQGLLSHHDIQFKLSLRKDAYIQLFEAHIKVAVVATFPWDRFS